MSNENEKIVPLHEDSKSHNHDEASYQKLMASQEAQRKEREARKTAEKANNTDK